MKEIRIKMGKETQDLSFTLSNSIVKTKFYLSLPTQKLLFFLITKIGYEEKMIGNVSNDKNNIVPFEKIKFLKDINVPLSEMKEFIKNTGRENSNDITEVLDKSILELGKNNIRWTTINEKNKKVKHEYSWFSKSLISEETGIFTFRFNDAIAEYLLHESNFFKSHLEEFVKLSSLNAINLYLLFRSNQFSKSIQTYYVDELKEYLGVEINYSRWDNFKKVVLDFSIEQLNKETNYFFTYEAKRIGRSIGKVEIRVIDKKNKDEFSDYFLEKIIEFLEKSKTPASIKNNFKLMKYEYDSNKNFIYISFKNEKILNDFLSQNPMFGISNISSSDILKGQLAKHIEENKEFQRYIKSMFRKDLKIYYK